MNNEDQFKKTIFKHWWIWTGLILLLGTILIICWVSGHKNSEQEARENAKTESGIGETPPPEIVRPTSTPVLSLPFDPADKPDALIPMGETIYHADAVDGHPGIDFQWDTDEEILITASMDASIVDIRKTESNGTYMVVTKSDDGWGVDYCGLDEVSPDLKVGDTIQIGDFIGRPNDEGIGKMGLHYKNFHWQFGYYDVTQPDIHQAGTEPRLCPMIYFDNNSRALIEQIWAETDSPTIRENAPEICSGGYKGRDR